MGRVEDARRRAAEAAADQAGVEPADTVLLLDAGDDVDVLAREPYPVEIAEHRRQRQAALPPHVAPLRPRRRSPRPIAAPRPLRTRPSACRSKSLFERIDAKLARKIVVDHDMAHASREQYRRLAATLHQSQMSSGLKVIMIASALSGEGKTLTASNLAMTFSESYQRTVLLIDGDLRKPSLDAVFGIDGSSGLSDGLTSDDEQPLTLHQVSQRLTILPGRPADLGSDGRPHVGSHAAGDRGSARSVRLGDHRHAAGRRADRRQPAGVDGGRRGARGQSGSDAAHSGRARRRGPRAGAGSSAWCSIAPGPRCTATGYEYANYYAAPKTHGRRFRNTSDLRCAAPPCDR